MAIQMFAAIDVGSFEAELSIYEISAKNGLRCIDHMRHVIALGSDTYKTGLISMALIDELCDTLGKFTKVMQSYHVDAYRACATSAMREAKNRMIVLDQIKVRTGLDVQIISNAEQRYLTYCAIPCKETEYTHIIEGPTAIVDVGFGSTQITMYNKGSFQYTQNIKLGALRMCSMLERFSLVGDYYSMAEELIDNEMDTFWTYYRRTDLRQETDDGRPAAQIIGVGDCIQLFVLKLMHRNTKVVSAEDFIQVYKEVRHISANDMVLQYDVPEEFAELIIPNAMIYYRFLIATGASALWIPGVNLCDGMVAEYASRQKLYPLEHDFVKETLDAACNIRARYYGNEEHSDMLVKIVSLLFDSMKKYHGLGKRSKLLLQIAAILHDVGKFISMSAPGECSYCIVKSTELLGLSTKEQLMLANIVRYNTVELPFDEAPADALDEESYRIVIKLTAILRLGNVLDRSHRQKIKDIKMSLKDNELHITVRADHDFSLEKGLLTEKATFFEQVFGVVPVLKQNRK